MNVYLKKQNLLWQKVVARVGILVLLIVILNFFDSPVRNSFYLVTSPFNAASRNAGTGVTSFFKSFWSASWLKGQVAALEKENQHLLSSIASLQDTIKNNQDLAKAIANTKDDHFKIVLAPVGGLRINEDMLIISRGSNDGIAEHMPVISDEKVLYGRVVKVYKNFSEVLLISAKNAVTNAKISSSIQNPNEDPVSQGPAIGPAIHGAIKGTGNLSFYLDLVNSDASIHQGDVVTTSGLEGFFPDNLLIGKIVSIDQNDVKPFQTAKVQPLFNPQDAENVFVIVNYQQP